MAGLFDDCLPLSYYYEKLNLDKIEIKENRNTIASIVSGTLVSIRSDYQTRILRDFVSMICFSLLSVGG